MNKVYSAFCGLLILLLLTAGCISLFDKDPVYSEHEKRELNSFPSISISGIFDGSFIAEIQEYYADTFPGREGMAESGGLYDFFFGFTGQLEEPEETEDRT